MSDIHDQSPNTWSTPPSGPGPRQSYPTQSEGNSRPWPTDSNPTVLGPPQPTTPQATSQQPQNPYATNQYAPPPYLGAGVPPHSGSPYSGSPTPMMSAPPPTPRNHGLLIAVLAVALVLVLGSVVFLMGRRSGNSAAVAPVASTATPVVNATSAATGGTSASSTSTATTTKTAVTTVTATTTKTGQVTTTRSATTRPVATNSLDNEAEIGDAITRSLPSGSWLAVMESMDKSSTSIGTAVAERMRIEGEGGLSVVDSSQIPGLNPGYWAIAKTHLASKSEVTAVCREYGRSMPTNCYARQVG